MNNTKEQSDKGPGLHKKVFDSKKSSIRKYCEMYVGKEGISPFLRYELLTFLFAPLPGALGLFLRKQF